MNTNTDPIFKAIADHAAARAHVLAIEARDHTDDELDVAASSQTEARDRLYETTPQTFEGVRALGQHLAMHWSEYLEHDDTCHFEPLFTSLAQIPPAQMSDPIFPLIAAADAAGAAELAACGKTADIPLSVANSRYEAQRRLFATAPTTIEGARALAAHVLKWWPHFFDDISEPLKPLFEGMAPQPIAATVDPIYDVIARNWAAWLAYVAACHLPGAGVDGSPDDKKQAQLCSAYHVTLEELGEARPTTFAGLAAIFDYVDTVDEFMDFGAHDPDQPAVLFRKMVAGVQALHLGMTANPSFSDPPPLSHTKLMDEIRERCRQEAANRNVSAVTD